VTLLEQYRNQRLDELWLDHDLGPDDTIWPVIELLERAAFDGHRFDIGLVTVHTANPADATRMARTLQHWGHQVQARSGSAELHHHDQPTAPPVNRRVVLPAQPTITCTRHAAK
jgi:hypothetical protein